MDKRGLKKLMLLCEAGRRRFLMSLPKDKRRELERQGEIDIPEFMRDRESRIEKARRKDKKKHP